MNNLRLDYLPRLVREAVVWAAAFAAHHSTSREIASRELFADNGTEKAAVAHATQAGSLYRETKHSC